MNKYIVIILAAATLGYFAWKKFNEKTAEPLKTEVSVKISNEKTFKDADLHKAFAKILDKENKKKKKRKLTIDELIEENLKNGSVEMTAEERRLVIEKLKLDISIFGKKFASAGAEDSGNLNDVELRIAQKTEQLENFQQIEAEYRGEQLENN